MPRQAQKCFRHAQNAHIKTILRMRKLSSGPLVSIHTFGSTGSLLMDSEDPDQADLGLRCPHMMKIRYRKVRPIYICNRIMFLQSITISLPTYCTGCLKNHGSFLLQNAVIPLFKQMLLFLYLKKINPRFTVQSKLISLITEYAWKRNSAFWAWLCPVKGSISVSNFGLLRSKM